MRIDIISSGWDFLRSTLDELERHSLNAGNIYLADPNGVDEDSIQKCLEGLAPIIKEFEARSSAVFFIGRLNGPLHMEVFRKNSPNLLLLAQIGVLSDDILDTVEVATLNAHPALLPFTRGMGAIEWALSCRVPVGVTVHYVDKGIDTGPIVSRRLVNPEGAKSVTELRRKAYAQCPQDLVLCVKRYVEMGQLEGKKQSVRYPYRKKPTKALIDRVESMVSAGEAEALYREWAEFAHGNQLSDELDNHPPMDCEFLK